ncbi:hypothetical protein CDV31_016942 [Fusarium ambrosium]|uniref:DUF7924 domain-containing protein n=1 Tax=Fusarium ambrosium TaxID=131363 RepID=A0A428RXU2_9HYPO|nr:hypothetical protein CDV31_016942 [Fusarium ambrosium]
MADHPQRPHKKRPPPDALEEPLSKRPCLETETPEIDDAAIVPRSQKLTQVPRAPKPPRLTKKNLRLLDKMTRTTKSGVASEPGKSKTASSSTTKTTRSDKIKSTTASGFQEQAIANGILAPRRSKPTHNAKEILERLNRSRETASPPESQYELYCGKIETAGNEAAVVQRMLPLFKDYDDTYNIDMNRAFSALPKDLGFNDGLSAPQPDFVQGLTREEFLPVDSSNIQGAVLFKDDATSTMLPHFAGEWKSRSGDMVEATLQSGYDGAALVYGRNQAREYLGEPDPPGHSAVTTFTSNGEHINFFAHHALPTGEDGAVEYHQHRLIQTNLTESYESFKRGRRQIRNAQDYAQEQSFALRDQLRKQRRSQRSRGSTAAPATRAPAAINPKVDGNEDDKDSEDYASYEFINMPNQPTPPVSTSSAQVSRAQPSQAQPSQASDGEGSVDSGRGKAKRSYWTKDEKTGRYCHVHSDGRSRSFPLPIQVTAQDIAHERSTQGSVSKKTGGD